MNRYHNKIKIETIHECEPQYESPINVDSKNVVVDECPNICYRDHKFCYKHCKVYGLETESNYFSILYTNIKDKFKMNTSVEKLKKCSYNDKDFNCGICYERYSNLNTLLFMKCCKNKQIICMDCLSNILIEYYLSRYYQNLVYNHYLFYLFSKTSFPCPFCRKYTSARELLSDTTDFISNIEKNVQLRLKCKRKENDIYALLHHFP